MRGPSSGRRVEIPTGSVPGTTKDCVTDLELVERAQRGDSDAFGVLVERHHRAALRAAVAALGAVDEADDAVQEAWIAARDRLAGFRGDAAFRTWLLAIVWHKATDRRRGVGRWVRRLVSMDAGDATPGAGAPPSRSPLRGPSPERAALDGEQQRTIARLVRALPPKLRDPLRPGRLGRLQLRRRRRDAGDARRHREMARLGSAPATAGEAHPPGVLSRDRTISRAPISTPPSTPCCRR